MTDCLPCLFAAAFILALASGFILIPLLKKLNFRQTVRDDGPAAHISKTGTPMMGGLIFLVPVAVFTAVAAFEKMLSIELLLAVVTTAAFAMIGFADDYLKAVKKNKNGLKPMQKIILQALVSAAFAVAALLMTGIGTSVYVPFFSIDVTLDLGLAYIPVIIIFMVFMTNAVNLTDGVDGLATGVTIITVIFLAAAATLAGASGAGGIGWKQIQSFCTVVAGGCLGFLAFNLHPARVFMGDTGSLALGGALCSAAVLARMPFVLLIAGGVYVAEALSVIIQVAVFKRTGKRIFRMAPLHHHFELSGWKENKVTAIFGLATLVLCALLIPALLP